MLRPMPDHLNNVEGWARGDGRSIDFSPISSQVILAIDIAKGTGLC